MNEADLVRIRQALEKDTLTEACSEMEKVLPALGYYLAQPFQPRSEQETECGR